MMASSTAASGKRRRLSPARATLPPSRSSGTAASMRRSLTARRRVAPRSGASRKVPAETRRFLRLKLGVWLREKNSTPPPPLSLVILWLPRKKEKVTAGRGVAPPPVCSPNHISRLHHHPAAKQEERHESKSSSPLSLRPKTLSLAGFSLSIFVVGGWGGLFGGLQNRGLARTRSSPKEGLRSRKRHL